MLWFGQASRTPVIAFHYERPDVAEDGDLATLVRLTAARRLHPEIGTLLPWEHAPAVIEDIRQRKLRGNAVLILN